VVSRLLVLHPIGCSSSLDFKTGCQFFRLDIVEQSNEETPRIRIELLVLFVSVKKRVLSRKYYKKREIAIR
jgi:hypothetical protein